ncbi:putative PB1 domain, tetratricopeptide-like helical domain superfamily [Helianthus annuus]|nr:putative PB1 domain, tetratricopeptide-like helical domain superfamily, protein PHOX1-4 [Helianthus annuus]KAJ0891544.1 putative PB1 domain, tetratricopeptide-like helical domain superfamily [Helianthus annuus]
MGKKSGKDKIQVVGSKSVENTTRKTYDDDTEIFISMAQEHKEEGNKLFQKKYYEAAISKYEKALKLLPKNHITVSYLHSSIAACYMRMGITEFPRAIHECNLALEVTPKYSKALLKRARCYEALNRVDLAFKDVSVVLDMEPKNVLAIEIADRLKLLMGEELTNEKSNSQTVNEETREEQREKRERVDEKEDFGESNEKISEKIESENGENDEKEAEDKLVVEEKISVFSNDNGPKMNIKLVYGDDIRWAKIPFNCDVFALREIISDRFPLSRAVLMKYRDQEGDMVTVTTNEELRWAESVSGQTGSVKLYIVEVNPEQDPFFDHVRRQRQKQKLQTSSSCIDDWILEFSQLFKNYVGFNSDDYLNLYEVGMKLYTDAMEDTITSEESQELFDNAADKFQEMAALALFNVGNVHMSKARKRADFEENFSHESLTSHIKDLYEWAQIEYSKAGHMYNEAIKVKPDFYEGLLALGHQQFEQAKLSWYYAIGTKTDLQKWDHKQVIELYNKAEENMEKGMKMWEDAMNMEKPKDDGAERVANMRSLINVLWGTMLYERSSMEYKLGLPYWHECLEIAVEKFEVAGVSLTDIAVIVKNHCSNDAAPEGLGFDIDEIIQAWHELYEVKRWQSGVPSFRLEPLFRRRVAKLFYDIEHVQQ